LGLYFRPKFIFLLFHYFFVSWWVHIRACSPRLKHPSGDFAATCIGEWCGTGTYKHIGVATSNPISHQQHVESWINVFINNIYACVGMGLKAQLELPVVLASMFQPYSQKHVFGPRSQFVAQMHFNLFSTNLFFFFNGATRVLNAFQPLDARVSFYYLHACHS